MRPSSLTAPLLVLAVALSLGTVEAQEIAGRVTDAGNGAPVAFAAVILLDADRNPLEVAGADIDGAYRVTAPGGGTYYLVVERLGYFENETPLFEIGPDGEYGIDLEMRPEPFRLDPIEVTVTNEELIDYLKLEFGQHPNSIPGYRSIQGIRLQEAKLKARDNTDLLRWLYIPVSHGRKVCVGTFGAPLPERMSYERTNARAAGDDPEAQCGALYVDGFRCRNEHIEDIVMAQISVVVTTRGSVYLYTRDFDWTFSPGGAAPAC